MNLGSTHPTNSTPVNHVSHVLLRTFTMITYKAFFDVLVKSCITTILKDRMVSFFFLLLHSTLDKQRLEIRPHNQKNQNQNNWLIFHRIHPECLRTLIISSKYLSIRRRDLKRVSWLKMAASSPALIIVLRTLTKRSILQV